MVYSFKSLLTMIKIIKFALVAVLLMMASAAHALNVEKSWKIVSPDKKTEVTVGTVNNIWLYAIL